MYLRLFCMMTFVIVLKINWMLLVSVAQVKWEQIFLVFLLRFRFSNCRWMQTAVFSQVFWFLYSGKYTVSGMRRIFFVSRFFLFRKRMSEVLMNQLLLQMESKRRRFFVIRFWGRKMLVLVRQVVRGGLDLQFCWEEVFSVGFFGLVSVFEKVFFC